MATPIRIKRSAVSGKRPQLTDLQVGELALNTYDGSLFTERDTGGVGIATTVSNLTPWTESYGASSISYLNSVGIGTDNPEATLDVFGGVKIDQLNVSGVSTFNNADVIFQGAAAGQNITFDASENDLEFTDNARLKFGNSDDLEIWHSGNSAIKNSTGDFKLRSDSLMLKRADDSEAYLKAEVNKSVEIYYGMGCLLYTSPSPRD